MSREEDIIKELQESDKVNMDFTEFEVLLAEHQGIIQGIQLGRELQKQEDKERGLFYNIEEGQDEIERLNAELYDAKVRVDQCENKIIEEVGKVKDYTQKMTELSFKNDELQEKIKEQHCAYCTEEGCLITTKGIATICLDCHNKIEKEFKEQIKEYEDLYLKDDEEVLAEINQLKDKISSMQFEEDIAKQLLFDEDDIDILKQKGLIKNGN